MQEKNAPEGAFCAFGTFGRGLPPCGIKVLEASASPQKLKIFRGPQETYNPFLEAS